MITRLCTVKMVKDNVVLGSDAHKIQQKKIAYTRMQDLLLGKLKQQVGIGEVLYL